MQAIGELGLLQDGRLPALLDKALDEWYRDRPDEMNPGATLESVVLAQHFCNFSLWELEEKARKRDAPAEQIAGIKRSIDFWNQRRNDLAEKIDVAVLDLLGKADVSSAQLHSETAGMMADRLSILSLKIRHMGVHAARKDDPALAAECRAKLVILRTQRADLCRCMEELLADFGAGRRFFKLYRQFKQYNDPRLNPFLRSGQKTAGQEG